jgi:hypothetical protein
LEAAFASVSVVRQPFAPYSKYSTDNIAEQLARILTAYIIIRLMQRFDAVFNAEVPPDGRARFHHTIENRSGTGVQVRLRYADQKAPPCGRVERDPSVE